MSLREAYEREVLGRVLDGAMAGTLPLRRRLLAAARGRVLEVGFGTGANAPCYPATVDVVVAVEPSAGLVARCRERLATWPVRVELVEASAARPLPLDAGSFDVAVLTFVLCSARRVPEVLAEVRRLVRPGGAVLVAEHVAAPGGARRAAQRAVRPAWQALLGGCDPARDTRAALERAGFDTAAVRDEALDLPWPVRTGIVGTATIR